MAPGQQETSGGLPGCDWLSTIPVLIGIRIAAAAGVTGAAAVLSERDAGSSSGSYALIAAAVLTIPMARIRWSLLGALLAGLAAVLVVYQRLFDLQHLLAATTTVVALLAWKCWRRRRPCPTKEVCPGDQRGQESPAA